MNVEFNEIAEIYQTILFSIDSGSKSLKLKLEFYPYVGINNKIRLTDDIVHVKLSDLLRDAPIEIHAALAEVLIRKLFRKRVPAAILEIYRNYVRKPEIRDKSIAARKTRGRKILSGSQGDCYNLDEIFNLINQLYFNSQIPKPKLTWSATKTFRILGHHDATHDTIVISKSLDNSKTPRFVVEYVVYHEMLHIKHPTKYLNGRRYNHTPDFRRDEREFAYFDDAENWIEANAVALRKTATKKPRRLW